MRQVIDAARRSRPRRAPYLLLAVLPGIVVLAALTSVVSAASPSTTLSPTTTIIPCPTGVSGTCSVTVSYSTTPSSRGSAMVSPSAPAGATYIYPRVEYLSQQCGSLGCRLNYEVTLNAEDWYDPYLNQAGAVWTNFTCSADWGWTCEYGSHGQFWDSGGGHEVNWGDETVQFAGTGQAYPYARINVYPSGQVTFQGSIG